MSQISGSWSAELDTTRLSRELALAVVAQLDQVDLVGALADAVVRRMADFPVRGPGSEVYDRGEGSPDPGAGARRGARFGETDDFSSPEDDREATP